jgi:hypothetical protein
MRSQDIVGPDQNQVSQLAAMPEAEEHATAKAELSELLRQIDQTKAEAGDARTLVKRLGDKARRVTDRYAESDLDEAQSALEGAHYWVEAALESLDKPDEPDEPKLGEGAVLGALTTCIGRRSAFGVPT